MRCSVSALPQALLDEVISALMLAERKDLVDRLNEHRQQDVLTSGQAASLLGVSSPNTVKNWLEAGHFPGAFTTAGGHWRFPREEVLAVRARMDTLRDKSRRGDLTPPDTGDDELPSPPLL